MTITRGVIGILNGVPTIAFTKPSVDYTGATPQSSLLWRNDNLVRALTPLTKVMSTVVPAHTSKNVTLPRKFAQFPIIFVQKKASAGSMYMPSKSQFVVRFFQGTNSFRIINQGVTGTFFYVVFDTPTA